MTKRLMVGDVAVGGGAPVSIQSMCNTKTDDVRATVEQIHALEAAGCEIIRIAIPDQAAAEAVDRIKEQISIPLIADIHFNYKYALACAERGIDAIRINPGNIGGEGGGGHLPPKIHPHPHWGQRRISGKGPAGQIRRRHGRGIGGERHGPRGPFEQVRF